MGKLSVQDKVCFLSFWALMLMYSAAERGYFLQNRPLPWDEARNHCQVCFKDLVTLTPANIQNITRNLTSEYWIGLRKTFSSSGMPWTRWANKDPLTFQNWYPGWPVLNSSLPERDCCSCSCTCPETASYEMTSAPLMMTSQKPVEATCTRTPMSLDEADTDQNYIEDPCVAMLMFGAWVERSCSERLRFICYEDPFIGDVDVTQVTSTSVNFTWLEVPSNISHYRVEVEGDMKLTENTTDLTHGFVNLTEATRYSVQVFPVKCGRDLNPQKGFFYTLPNKVKSITVINVTETSVFLNWSKPAGNVDFYCIKFGDKQIETFPAGKEITNLIPGTSYTFKVYSGISNSILSEETNATTYTRPGKVTNLRVSISTKNSLLLHWDPPEGRYTGFWVTAVNDNNLTLFEKNLTQSQVNVTGLLMCRKITLSVTALANGTLEGDKVMVVNYTEPEQISNLVLKAGFGSISAKWDLPEGNCSSFFVKLQLNGICVKTDNLTQHNTTFDSLKTAANYTVIIYSVSGHIMSPPRADSIFTLPVMPTELDVKPVNKTYVNLKWKAPDNIETALYRVDIYSNFWGQNWTVTVENKTSLILGPLNSGSKYQFDVRTVADSLSAPANVLYDTAPDLREISLSMLCSSEVSLLCDKESTRKDVFKQLESHFRKVLKDEVYWNLERVTGNPGT